MSSPDVRAPTCAACGRPMPAQADRCPACGRGRAEAELRPLGGSPGTPTRRPPRLPASAADLYRAEPVTPAPGQEVPGSWAYIKGIMRADKVFAALLVLMGLETLLNLGRGSITGALISGAILWGVLTLQWWGYLLAMGLSIVYLVVMVGAVLAAFFLRPAAALLGGVILLAPIAVTVFVIVVLYTRRQHFA